MLPLHTVPEPPAPACARRALISQRANRPEAAAQAIDLLPGPTLLP